jgi:hypothetical protein
MEIGCWTLEGRVDGQRYVRGRSADRLKKNYGMKGEGERKILSDGPRGRGCAKETPRRRRFIQKETLRDGACQSE